MPEKRKHKKKSTSKKRLPRKIENSKTIASVHWVSVDPDEMSSTVVSEPTSQDGELVVDTVQIVEFYSK